MSNARRRFPDLTDAEEARIQAGIANDPANPELTAEQLAAMRPASEVLPAALYRALTGAPGSEKARTKQLISIRLDPDVIEHFRAGGPGWQSRINAALREKLRAPE